MTNTNQPIIKLKDRGIIVTAFKNEVEYKVYYNTTLEKRFKKGEQWESTNNLNETDLRVASRMLSND